MVIAASYRLVYTDASPNITFGLTFDEPFKKVIIQIAGDYDVMGRNFTFENSKYIVAYFQIDQSRCRPQYYYINYLYTEDLIGNKGEYIRGSSTNVDQFSYLPSTPSEITCPSTTIDTDAPMITSVAISQISDPFKQLVQVLFTTYDTAPGISETNIPLCSFYSDNDYFSAQAESINTNANGSINYKCVVDIPIGYDPTIILSIYGISDLHYNYIGYSSAGLLNANLPYNFTLTPITNPVITSTSSLEQSSDKLIISGHNFIRPIGTCVVNIVYNSTNSGILTPSIVTGSTIVLLNIPSAVNYTISVRDTTSLVLSNSVFLKGHITIIPSESSETPPTLSPTPTSTPTPEPVKCKSDCGASIGSGKCVNGVCVCNPPYNGLDCSSKTDNSTIIPDPVKPSVNVTIPGTSSGQTPEFTSFIYVYGLREIDDTSVINDFVFNNDKWILVKEGSSSNEQVTTVQYKYLLDNSYNTTIVSTVQVFAQATNITFGNQQLFMNPSTIKFTFNITSYPFAKSTNFLQLVMNAALQSTEKTACSFKEFVDDQSNSQYLKLQIEDRSLFGRFIKFGMIDGREQVVTNTQLDNFYGGKELSTSTSDQSYIGLNIPYYTKYALLDPDFSILIEQSHAKNIVNSICTNSKRSLSNGQIAGIVVGGVIFVCVVVSAVIYGLSETARSNFAVKLRKMAISNNGGGPQ
ncbi:hypothetical protein CYY_002203 [Polysphondylium violaceum]|uniref:EGF-like domain-containing protein n=1 Tax=Polysphondylium violaceum TaxID=133409 RepID=A0A8J4PZL6_9MYCE|nr:hypothetical protein CYY_002203 [Polysphondylium violaceum]